MKRFVKPAAIMDELESTRAEIHAAAQSVRAAAGVGLVAFGLVALVAVVALMAATSRGGNQS